MGYATGVFVTLAMIMLQAISAAARGAPDSFADLAERLSPAVVADSRNTASQSMAQRCLVRLDGPGWRSCFQI